ncbi:MAG: hypothetical protein WD049_04115 [Candidatus Paceibacterota bacterium]
MELFIRTPAVSSTALRWVRNRLRSQLAGVYEDEGFPNVETLRVCNTADNEFTLDTNGVFCYKGARSVFLFTPRDDMNKTSQGLGLVATTLLGNIKGSELLSGHTARCTTLEQDPRILALVVRAQSDLLQIESQTPEVDPFQCVMWSSPGEMARELYISIEEQRKMVSSGAWDVIRGLIERNAGRSFEYGLSTA